MVDEIFCQWFKDDQECQRLVSFSNDQDRKGVWLPDSLPYKLATPNLDAGFRAVLRYDRPQFIYGEAEFNTAMQWAENEFGQVCGNSKVIFDLDDAISCLDGKASPGWPWNLWAGEKKNLFSGDLKEAFRTHMEDYLEALKTWERVPVFWLCTVKEEIKPRIKVLANNIRTFVSAPVQHDVVGQMLFGEVCEKLYASTITSSFIGHSKYGRGMDAMYRRIRRFPNWFCMDESEFDATLDRNFLFAVFEIVWRCLEESARTEENRKIAENWFHEIVYKIIVMEDGTLVQANTGNPSGNKLTILINTWCLKMLFNYAWIVLAQENGKEVDLAEMRANTEFALVGDDNLWSVSDECVGWFNNVTVTRVWLSMGIVVKIGTAGDEKDFDQIDFLQESPVLLESHGCFVTKPKTEKMLASMSMHCPSKHARWTFVRCCALRLESYWNVACRSVFDRHIAFLEKKHFETLRAPQNPADPKDMFTYEQCRSMYKSDQEIEFLYLLTEGARSSPWTWVDWLEYLLGDHVPRFEDLVRTDPEQVQERYHSARVRSGNRIKMSSQQRSHTQKDKAARKKAKRQRQKEERRQRESGMRGRDQLRERMRYSVRRDGSRRDRTVSPFPRKKQRSKSVDVRRPDAVRNKKSEENQVTFFDQKKPNKSAWEEYNSKHDDYNMMVSRATGKISRNYEHRVPRTVFPSRARELKMDENDNKHQWIRHGNHSIRHEKLHPATSAAVRKAEAEHERVIRTAQDGYHRTGVVHLKPYFKATKVARASGPSYSSIPGAVSMTMHGNERQDTVIAHGMDFVETVTSGPGPGFMLANSYPLNPGMAMVFPILSVEASTYSQYRFLSLEVIQVTFRATTYSGVITQWYEPNPGRVPPQAENQVNNQSCFSMATVYTPQSLKLAVTGDVDQPYLLVRNGNIPADGVIRDFDQGVFAVYTDIPDGAITESDQKYSISKMWIKYTVELNTRRVPDGAGDSMLIARVGTGSINAPILSATGGTPVSYIPFGGKTSELIEDTTPGDDLNSGVPVNAPYRCQAMGACCYQGDAVESGSTPTSDSKASMQFGKAGLFVVDWFLENVNLANAFTNYIAASYFSTAFGGGAVGYIVNALTNIMIDEATGARITGSAMNTKDISSSAQMYKWVVRVVNSVTERVYSGAVAHDRMEIKTSGTGIADKIVSNQCHSMVRVPDEQENFYGNVSRARIAQALLLGRGLYTAVMYSEEDGVFESRGDYFGVEESPLLLNQRGVRACMFSQCGTQQELGAAERRIMEIETMQRQREIEMLQRSMLGTSSAFTHDGLPEEPDRAMVLLRETKAVLAQVQKNAEKVGEVEKRIESVDRKIRARSASVPDLSEGLLGATSAASVECGHESFTTVQIEPKRSLDPSGNSVGRRVVRMMCTGCGVVLSEVEVPS